MNLPPLTLVPTLPESADVVVLAVPHSAVDGIVRELGEALTGKVVVDATNPLNDTYSDLTTSGVADLEHGRALTDEPRHVEQGPEADTLHDAQRHDGVGVAVHHDITSGRLR